MIHLMHVTRMHSIIIDCQLINKQRNDDTMTNERWGCGDTELKTLIPNNQNADKHTKYERIQTDYTCFFSISSSLRSDRRVIISMMMYPSSFVHWQVSISYYIHLNFFYFSINKLLFDIIDWKIFFFWFHSHLRWSFSNLLASTNGPKDWRSCDGT